MPQYESVQKSNGAISNQIVTGRQVSTPVNPTADDYDPLPEGFPKRGELTSAGLQTVSAVLEATDEELLSVDGVGEKSLKDIQDALDEITA
jgi:DNA uptake protein ComE-like DNA-binding protein